MSAQRPDIYSYQDYRLFLKDWFAYKKASRSSFSLRQLAKEVGLASGYLPMVLSGRRALSADVLSRLLARLGLNVPEQSFLESLVKFQTSASNDVHVAALERMKRFSGYQKASARESVVSDYLTHWYYVAIREMAGLPDFTPDPLWLRERLRYPVSLKELKEALAFLQGSGFLRVDGNGKVRAPDKALDCSGEVFRVALAKFHREALGLAARSVESVPSEERMISGHTCALSRDNFAKAKTIAEEAIQKIRALGENDRSGEEVYHFELALFPMTRGNEKGSENGKIKEHRQRQGNAKENLRAREKAKEKEKAKRSGNGDTE